MGERCGYFNRFFFSVSLAPSPLSFSLALFTAAARARACFLLPGREIYVATRSKNQDDDKSSPPERADPPVLQITSYFFFFPDRFAPRESEPGS